MDALTLIALLTAGVVLGMIDRRLAGVYFIVLGLLALANPLQEKTGEVHVEEVVDANTTRTTITYSMEDVPYISNALGLILAFAGLGLLLVG